MTSYIDQKKLFSFIQVAETLSFSKAAQRTGYSVPAISIQVKNLANELGVILFKRRGNQIELTNNGKKLYHYAKEYIRLNEEMISDFSSQSNKPSGRIQIGATDSVCDTLLSDLIEGCTKRYPQLNICIYSYSPKELRQYLVSELLDAVIMVDNPVVDERLILVKNLNAKVIVCCSSEFAMAEEKHLTINDLQRYPCLLTEKGESYRNNFENALAEKNIYLSPVVESKSTKLLIDLLKKGIGYSVLPEFFVHNELASGEIIPIKVEGLSITIQLQILCNKEHFMSQGLNAFISLAKRLVRIP